MNDPKPVVYYGATIRARVMVRILAPLGEQTMEGSRLCSQSENNNPSLMEGWFTLQAEFQVAWMVPTGPSLTNLQVAHTQTIAEVSTLVHS